MEKDEDITKGIYKLNIRKVEFFKGLEDRVYIRVSWSGTIGFGQLTLSQKDGKFYIDSEGLSDFFVLELFTALAQYIVKNSIKEG